MADANHLRACWATEGKVRDGASPTAIDAFQQRLGHPLPSSFRQYLLIVDGMEEAQWWGDRQIDFWSLAKIETEAFSAQPGLISRDGLVLLCFADFLIGSHDYAIQIAPTAPPTV